MKSLPSIERQRLLLRRQFLMRSAGVLAGPWFNSRVLGAQTPQAAPSRGEAISPKDGTLALFNGKDLTGLYGWLKDSHYQDPRRVFTVQNGILQISGEVDGYLATKEQFRDYRLVVEYKWGDRTYGSKTVRNSGILLHAIGQDGNPSPWMSSIECQVAQGCVGDFIVIRGKDAQGSVVPVTLTSDTILGSDGRTRWKKGELLPPIRANSSGGLNTILISRSSSIRAAKTTLKARSDNGPVSSAFAPAGALPWSSMARRSTNVMTCFPLPGRSSWSLRDSKSCSESLSCTR